MGKQWKINLEICPHEGLPYYDVMFENGYIYYGDCRIYIDDEDDALDTLILLERLGNAGVAIGKLWAVWQRIKARLGCPIYHTLPQYVKARIDER